MGALAKRVVIEKIFDDMIVLGVPDSCWLQELYLLGPTILQTINQSLDSPRIKEIRFKQAGRTPPCAQKSTGFSKLSPDKRAPSTILLSSAERKRLAEITDPELRTALEAFLIRCHRERKQ